MVHDAVHCPIRLARRQPHARTVATYAHGRAVGTRNSCLRDRAETAQTMTDLRTWADPLSSFTFEVRKAAGC